MAVDPRLLPIAPFLYFGKRHRQLAQGLRLDRPAQRSAFNFWRVLDGTAVLEGPAGEQFLRPDDVAISEPGTPVLLHSGATVIHLAFDIVYRPRFRKQRGCVIDVRMPPQPTWAELFDCPLPRDPPADWRASARRFAEEALDRYWRSAAAHVQVNAALHLLLARLIAWQAKEDPPPSGGLIRRAEALIQERAHTGLDVDGLAAALQVSRQHLSRRFTLHRGYGPGKALLRHRLDRARYLLQVTDADIPHVALESGFGSVSVMRRAFARELGMSPSQWRNRSRAAAIGDVTTEAHAGRALLFHDYEANPTDPQRSE